MSLYHQRGSVEPEFGRLKNERAMLPLRVRRIHRVRLHVDLDNLGHHRVTVCTTRLHWLSEFPHDNWRNSAISNCSARPDNCRPGERPEGPS